MKIKISKKKLKIIELNTLWEKFKGLKFNLEPLDCAYRFKSKYANTYFLCQRVDIIMTNESNKILRIYKDVKSEKIILPKLKTKYVYFLPVDSTDKLEIGDTLKIED